MPRIHRTAILGAGASRAFKVVNQVESYPDFLPGCQKVKILESTKNIRWSKLTLPGLAFLRRS